MALSIDFDLTFEEALEWGEGRISALPDIYYDELPAQARSRAFTVSGLAALDQIQKVLDSLNEALANGDTFEEWKETVPDEAMALGKDRLDNVFRTAVQTHYNVGRWRQAQRNKAHRRFMIYDAINDGRTRPHHRALDNFIAPIDDPAWERIYPPNGYRCRCSTRTLTEAQAVARGWKGAAIMPPDGGADDGWDYNPATGQDDMLKRITSERLGKLTDRILREAAEKALNQG